MVRQAAKDDADVEPRSPPTWSIPHSILRITPLLAVYEIPFEAGQIGVFEVGVGVGAEPDEEVELEIEVVALFRIAPHTFCMGTPD